MIWYFAYAIYRMKGCRFFDNWDAREIVFCCFSVPEAPLGGSPELTGGPGRSLKVMGRALEAPWVAPRGARELLGGSWAGPGWLLGHSEALLTIGVSILEVSGALRRRQKIVREHFFEFPGGQIVIFPRF